MQWTSCFSGQKKYKKKKIWEGTINEIGKKFMIKTGPFCCCPYRCALTIHGKSH